MSQSARTDTLAQLVPDATDAGVRPAGFLHAGRSLSLAMHGMAATSHSLATQVALDILKKGGSAVDAAVAANAMLSFVEPMMCGPGGDLFAIVWDPASKKLRGLNGSGRSPLGLTRRDLQDLVGADATRMPSVGPLSVTVPGAVAAWFELHASFGRLPMGDLLAPAIAYAREGVATPEVIAHEWKRGVEFLRDALSAAMLQNLAAAYLPGGRTPAKGELFRNPPLADFLARLAKEGRDYFYRGEGAARITAYLSRTGGRLTREDFAAHEGTWVEPVSVNYRGYDVFELPPNGQGIAALQMLNIVEGFDLAALGRANPEFWHLMIEAKKLAFEDRARHYADPDYMRMPIERLLSKEYAAERRALIGMQNAMPAAEAGTEPIEKGDTVYLAIADGDGMMVSLIQSIAGSFGSGLVPDGLGFALQNRGAGFALEPGHPNEYAPGKRPFHTIIPAFVTKDGEPLVAFGLMGGSMQPQGHAQIIVNLVDFGMDLQAAGDAARFRHEGSSAPGARMRDGGHTIVEPGIPARVLDDLRRRGHRIELAREDFGGYEAVSRDPRTGVLGGASEMRKDGSAAGY